jgi:hypothetical protein
METELIFSEMPNVEFATNTFENVPVILRKEDIRIYKYPKVWVCKKKWKRNL